MHSESEIEILLPLKDYLTDFLTLSSYYCYFVFLSNLFSFFLFSEKPFLNISVI